jgi:hypothetical protein
MSKLLNEVKKVNEKRNVTSIKTYHLPMEKFIMEIYLNCAPCTYGILFPKKILHDMHGKIEDISPKLDRGDIHINNKVFFETKISYRGKSGKYNLTNLRDWQKLDYFIFCFVDTQDNFTPHFYCVPVDTIFDNPCITLTAMNNTSSSNKNNQCVGKRTTINSDDLEWLFDKTNVLKGTTYNHLTSFINRQYTKLKTHKQNEKSKKK